jgi:enoyl-CoA hydratase
MKAGLTIGHAARLSAWVASDQVIHLGRESGQPGAIVFSTPAMINLMEHAARRALEPYLEAGEDSVGVRVTVEHLAATPIAAAVRTEARVVAVDGRQVDFEVEAHDHAELIGRGSHRRAVIRLDRLADRLKQKSNQLPQGMVIPMQLSPEPGELGLFSTLVIDRRDAVLVVTLNRPKQLNALSIAMTDEWRRLLAWLAAHPEVRVVVVTGSGKAFCAGDDVKQVATLDIEAARQLSHQQAEAFLAMEGLPQVFIAAVNGHALGAGCVWAYSCDFRIAAHDARFGMPEILLGWPPGYGIAQLTALVGKAKALELCLTGRQLTAQEALACNLVQRLVPQSQLLPAAFQLAAELLAKPPLALSETKRQVHGDEGSHAKTAYLADTAAYIRCLDTPDAREGIAAFTEKRPPQFGGR